MKIKITNQKPSAAVADPKNQPKTNAASASKSSPGIPPDHTLAPPAKAPVAPTTDTVKVWIGNITQAFAGHVGGDIEAGLQLIKAKETLIHGQWIKLFKRDGLPFSQRIAQKLMAIARNQYFSNANNYSFLPVRREVAYQLSDLSPEALAAGVNAGRITPKMSIKKAVEFTLEQGGVSKQQARAEEPLDKHKSLARLERFLRKEFDLWPVTELEELVSAFDGFIGALERRANKEETSVEQVKATVA